MKVFSQIVGSLLGYVLFLRMGKKLRINAARELGDEYEVKVGKLINPKIKLLNVKEEDVTNIPQFLKTLRKENIPDETEDYNLPNVTWENDGYGLSAACRPSSPATELSNIFGYLNLFQVNSVPNSRNILLDLIFSNVNIIVNTPLDYLFENSLHHSSVCFDLVMQTSSRARYEEYYFDFLYELAVIDCGTAVIKNIFVRLKIVYLEIPTRFGNL
nr:unnamed protein product [Callosobruchus chinensis]